MDVATLAIRLLLAAVLAGAGAAKLADLAGSRRAAADFGMPRRLAGPLGTLLPLVELMFAGLLLPAGTARVGAGAAAGLLAVFGMAIAVNLLLGRRPVCNCFGGLGSARIDWRAARRNAALAAAAAAVAAAPETPAAVAFAAAAAAFGLAAIAAGRRRDRPGTAASGPEAGSAAPDFRLPAPGGIEVALGDLLAGGKPLVLVFTDPRCGPCVELAPELAALQRRPDSTVELWVVARGDEEENRLEAAEHGLRNLLLDPDQVVADAYGAGATPSALLVGPDGRVAGSLAIGAHAIRDLVDATSAAPSAAPSAEPPAVEDRLTRLDLLARAAVAAGALLASGAGNALAGVIPITIQCKYVRCGNRCCPKKAVCGTRRGKKVCICPDGREACGSKCCAETFVCHKTARGKKVCICPPRTRLCRGRCVPLTDPAHCGSCGRECPPATVCVAGQCVGGDGSGTGAGGTPPCECPPGQTCCEGACTDLNADERHCGRCDQPCPEGQTCCDGECKDLQHDPQHCGGCGKRCPAGKVCADGRCLDKCPSGRQTCGRQCCGDREQCKDGTCVQLGPCGTVCGDTPSGGFGVICCDGDCVPSYTDPGHCGGCGRKCVSPTPDLTSCGCSQGECLTIALPGGEPCVASRALTRLERVRLRASLRSRR